MKTGSSERDTEDDQGFPSPYLTKKNRVAGLQFSILINNVFVQKKPTATSSSFQNKDSCTTY